MQQMTPTERNYLLGLFADATQGVTDWFGTSTNPLEDTGTDYSIAGLISEAARPVAGTLDLLSYGEPLTRGRGQTLAFKPDVRDTVAGMLPGGPAGRRAAQEVGEVALRELGPKAGAMAEDYLRGIGGVKDVYRTNTKGSPDPTVGTHYKTTDLGGKHARKPVDWDSMEGSSLMVYPADSTSLLYQVDEVSDVPLDRKVVTEAGHAYSRKKGNPENKIAFASNDTAAESQNLRALAAREENLAKGGDGRVFFSNLTMGPDAANFSTMPTDVLLSLYETVGMRPEIAAELDRRVREATVRKGNKSFPGLAKDWVGIQDSGAREQLMTGEGVAMSGGNLRKLFMDKFTSKEAQKALGFNMEDLRNSVIDPLLIDKPANLLGENVYLALPERGISPSSHSSYSHDLPGVYYGSGDLMSVDGVFGGLFDEIYKQHKGKRGDPYRMAAFDLGMKQNGVSLFMDKETIDRIKSLLGE